MKKLQILSLLFYYSCLIGLAQDTQGFFMDDFQQKTAVIPQHDEYIQPSVKPDVSITIDINQTIAKVSKYVYGNNSNVYMGQMVTEPDLIKYIKDISPNVIRYPGGNLSNLFFWNASKGNPPADAPEKMLNGKRYPGEYWYGMSKDTLTMNIDNYYLMLKMTNSTGIISVNYGYARYSTSPKPVESAAHMAANWVRYDKGRTKFWEIGNENFGPWQAGFEIDSTLNKDHQPKLISGELYGTHFKIFTDSMRKAAKEIGAKIELGAVIVEAERPESWYNQVETNWNKGFFKAAGNYADFFVIHSYFTPFNENSEKDAILNTATTEVKNMLDYMVKMCLDLNVTLKPLALSEWNIRAIKSRQSCSYINGLHATMVLGELIKNKFGEASRWDLANGYENGDDHGTFSIGDEPGVPKWNPRPNYFYLYYFQKFFGDHMIKSTIKGNSDIVSYASKFSSGQTALIIVNKTSGNHIAEIIPIDNKPTKRYYFYSLTGGTDNGDFSQRVYVNGHNPDYLTGGPIKNLENIKAFSSQTNNGIVISSPAYSVQYIIIE
jgi:hypothetical protein